MHQAHINFRFAVTAFLRVVTNKVGDQKTEQWQEETAMPIGQAYSNILSTYEQKALQIAGDLLMDHFFEDLETIQETQNVANTTIGMYLPERYLYKYTPLFCKQFIVCFVTITWKLAQAKHTLFASLAEELAAWTLVREAQRLLQDDLEGATDKDNLDAFIDEIFEDTDFEFLFDDAYDGIDETAVGEAMGMTSLAFDDWFKPFSGGPDRIVHPYVVQG